MKCIRVLSLLVFTVFNSYCTEVKSKIEIKSIVQKQYEITEQSSFTQQQITANLYVLKATNYNTNIGIYIGKDSIILIDPMSGNNNQQQLLNAIKQLSSKPIKYVINTHHHMDHTGANGYFKNLGAIIVSHENVKYSNAIYDITFKDSYTINMGNETIKLYHNISHTFDDVLVYFKNSNALFMGDTYMTNSFPHFYYGGGSKGHLNNIDTALSLGNENTYIIPAHGKLVSNKTELSTYKENSLQWISRIKELHYKGKSSSIIADDEKIKQLSLIFNNGKTVSKQSMKRTLNKTISSDLIPSTTLSKNILKTFVGIYFYENGQVDEILLQQNILILKSKGKYIYEIVPISKTKFQIKGQFPNKYLTFSDNSKQFIFFNGKDNLIAKRK